MDRKEFISKLGVVSVGVGCGMGLQGCEKFPDPGPGEFDMTIDLTESTYADLVPIGGYTYIENNIIVGHLSDGGYIAATRICTHRNCIIEFDKNDHFPCPYHGALFDTDGTVLKGPARKPIFMYFTEVNGDYLRIYT